jgi:putative ABC transport system permease protein
MLRNYIKFALRNFRSNKVIFFGSILTLSLGALCISLLFSYVDNETSMDDFHKKKKNIYMMVSQDSPGSQWNPMGFYSKNFNYKKYPEIKEYVQIIKYSENDMRIGYQQNSYSPEGIVVDTTFFNVFDFELKIGNKKTVFKERDAIILSEGFAKKVFGSEDPIGKKLKVESSIEVIGIVRGIVKDTPSNSSLTFDFILPSYNDNQDPNKYNRYPAAFILTNDTFNKDVFSEKIKDIRNNLEKTFPKLTESRVSIVPFNDLYFDKEITNFNKLFSIHGDKNVIFTLIIIMLVILVITTLNFSNLQLINSNTRTKYRAINIVNGAKKSNLIFLKLVEVFLLLSISTFIITLVYQFTIPSFNDFMQVQLSPPIWWIILINASVLLLVSLLSIIYPAITATKTSLISGLKNTINSNSLASKNVIIFFQYALTFILLISSIIVAKQLDMMLNKDLGFTNKNIISTKLFHRISFKLQDSDFNNYKENQPYIKAQFKKFKDEDKAQQNTYQVVNNELKNHSSIKNFTQGGSPLKASTIDWKPKNSAFEYSTQKLLVVSPNYKKVHGLTMVEGRFFIDKKDKSRGPQIVINEAAKKYWGIKDITKTQLLNKSWSRNETFPYEIIGVVKDFNFDHLSSKPAPLIMIYFQDRENNYLIQFEDNNVQAGLDYVKELNKKSNPGSVFKYSFLTDEIKVLYQKEKRLATVYTLFTIIALLISAIGLFTIALYDTQRRVKEVGIRKVNGATIREIVFMLNKDFIKWVVIAIIVASPISYYLMHSWLENFAYKTAISWWVFALASGFTLILALLTVSWQSLRAATNNPVESLRDE